VPASVESEEETLETKMGLPADRTPPSFPRRTFSCLGNVPVARTAFSVLPANDDWDRVAAHCQSHPQQRNVGRNPFGSFHQVHPPPEMKGPRLIPLDEKREDTGLGKTGEYYSKLAEKLLGTRK
jgi:hypothetical protein